MYLVSEFSFLCKIPLVVACNNIASFEMFTIAETCNPSILRYIGLAICCYYPTIKTSNSPINRELGGRYTTLSFFFFCISKYFP